MQGLQRRFILIDLILSVHKQLGWPDHRIVDRYSQPKGFQEN